MNDFLVFGIAYLYVIIVLLVGEVLRKKFEKTSEFTRKIIHIFAGFSVYTVLFFDHPWVANIVALTFVILLYLAGPSSPIKALKEMFGTMERQEEGEKLWGPFYYAISILSLTLIFTLTGLAQLYWLAAAPLTIMYLGDGLAPIIGRKYAKHVYTIVKGSKRSVIGTLTLFVAGFGGAIFAMWFNGIFAITVNFGAPFVTLTWDVIIIYSLIAAGIATIIEFFSPKGLDNLTVPFGTCGLLCLIFFLGF
jgi:phytol kinase